MIAWIWLVATAVLGTVALRWAVGRALSAIETVAGGIVVGWAAATWLVYGIAAWRGHLEPAVLFGLTVVVGVLAGIAALTTAAGWRREWPLAPADRQSLLYGALLAPIVAMLFAATWLAPRSDGLYASGRSWNEVGWHAALAASMLFGGAIPPQNPLMADVGAGYYVLSDVQLATLMGLGQSFHAAAVVTGVTTVLAVVVLVCGLARRVTGQAASTPMALLLFVSGGGLGFTYILEYARTARQSLWETVSQLADADHTLAHVHLHVANVLTDGFLAQRPVLVGMALALVVFLLVADVWREPSGSDDDGQSVTTVSPVRLLAVAGLIVGALPLWNVFAWIVAVLTGALWALAKPHRGWIAFAAGAVVLAAPQVVFLLSGAEDRVATYLLPGWFARYDGQYWLFWLRNLGVPLLVAVPAWMSLVPAWRAFLMPFWAVLALAATVMFSPSMDDNVQLMYFWQLANGIAVAEWLRRLTSPPLRQRWLAAVLVVASVASGALAIIRESQVTDVVFQPAEVRAATFIRQHTSPQAVFVTATVDDNIGPVALAGRRTVAGGPATDWGLGNSGTAALRRYDVSRIFRNDPEARALLVRYGVDYIYFGPTEQWQYQTSRKALAKRYPVVYDRNGLTIFQARRPVLTAL